MKKLVKILIIHFLLGNGVCERCKCNLEIIRGSFVRNSSLLGKRQLSESMEDGDSSEVFGGGEGNESIDEIARHQTSTLVPEEELHQTQFDVNKSESQRSRDIKSVCPFYKRIPPMNLEKLADVWQVAQYKTSDKLRCFKIHLKNTTPENRRALHKRYSSFNNTIDWEECYLEIVSTDKKTQDRRHFLQGNSNNDAILENIVVSEEIENDTKIITLQEQSPDQWLVYKNLLLMRDCDNGDIIIFTRVPTQTNRRDMEQAMKIFGEDDANDMVACDENYNKSVKPFLNVKYHIVS